MVLWPIVVWNRQIHLTYRVARCRSSRRLENLRGYRIHLTAALGKLQVADLLFDKRIEQHHTRDAGCNHGAHRGRWRGLRWGVKHNLRLVLAEPRLGLAKLVALLDTLRVLAHVLLVLAQRGQDASKDRLVIDVQERRLRNALRILLKEKRFGKAAKERLALPVAILVLVPVPRRLVGRDDNHLRAEPQVRALGNLASLPQTFNEERRLFEKAFEPSKGVATGWKSVARGRTEKSDNFWKKLSNLQKKRAELNPRSKLGDQPGNGLHPKNFGKVSNLQNRWRPGRRVSHGGKLKERQLLRKNFRTSKKSAVLGEKLGDQAAMGRKHESFGKVSQLQTGGDRVEGVLRGGNYKGNLLATKFSWQPSKREPYLDRSFNRLVIEQTQQIGQREIGLEVVNDDKLLAVHVRREPKVLPNGNRVVVETEGFGERDSVFALAGTRRTVEEKHFNRLLAHRADSIARHSQTTFRKSLPNLQKETPVFRRKIRLGGCCAGDKHEKTL